MISLDELDKKIISETQDGLPLVERPFAVVAKKIGIDEDELIRRLRNLKERKLIRRFGGALVPHKSVFKNNVLILWRIPENRDLNEAGEKLAAHHRVSHCYHRKTNSILPYQIYSMTHATDEEDMEKVVTELKSLVGIDDILLLHTLHEYKKSSAVYVF